jgi:hypothetical protein
LLGRQVGPEERDDRVPADRHGAGVQRDEREERERLQLNVDAPLGVVIGGGQLEPPEYPEVVPVHLSDSAWNRRTLEGRPRD